MKVPKKLLKPLRVAYCASIIGFSAVAVGGFVYSSILLLKKISKNEPISIKDPDTTIPFLISNGCAFTAYAIKIFKDGKLL